MKPDSFLTKMFAVPFDVLFRFMIWFVMRLPMNFLPRPIRTWWMQGVVLIGGGGFRSGTDVKFSFDVIDGRGDGEPDEVIERHQWVLTAFVVATVRISYVIVFAVPTSVILYLALK